MKEINDNRRTRDIPPLVGLLNLPARPLLPGGMLAVTSVGYSGCRERWEGILGAEN